MNTVKSAGKLGSLLLCLSSLLWLASPTLAQSPDTDQPSNSPVDQSIDQPSDNPNQPDPPSRVARLSYLDGSVSMQPGGDGDWGAAAKNRPITIGDKLWVDKDS